MVLFQYRFAGSFCVQKLWASYVSVFKTPEKEKRMETKNKVATTGERLRTLREISGIGQKELAAEFYLSDKTVVSKYERGLRDVPAEIIVMYAEKFGVTTDWILRGETGQAADLNRIAGIPGFDELAQLYYKLGSAELRGVALDQIRALARLS
ncbi:MAG: helix-turn-helix transcriptional regulator [Butyrivibrio sp.]|nr:helix-turn-helix transcriptional regulator [Butyrivibrio sp.]